MSAREETLAAVGPQWESAAAIAGRVGWAPRTVRARLDELRQEGLVEGVLQERTPPTSPRWLYRLKVAS